MPIPFLLIGLGGLTGTVGIAKTIKAGVDQNKANDTNTRAKDIIEGATREINIRRAESGEAIGNLGQKKLWVLNNSIKPFIFSFEKIHNVELSESIGLDELQNFHLDVQSFGELKQLGEMASSLLGGTAGGAALGAITAFGAYGGAMTFGAASTGTAIASLSGAAATNATLAFLGGGALSVGGLGMAGGTAVLGGLVAGPALAVMGFVMGAKASANKGAAYSNLAKAKEYKAEMEAAGVLCNGIRLRADMFNRLLIKLDVLFGPLVYEMEQIIINAGTDYSRYSVEQKQVIAKALSIAGALKAVLDTPILTENGELASEAEETAGKIQALIEAE